MYTAFIDWDEFNNWVGEVKGLRGFEMMPIVYEGWEDDDPLPLDEVAAAIYDNLDDLDPDDMFEWFEYNDERIDWDEFKAWAVELKDEPGYEWLDDIFIFDNTSDRNADKKTLKKNTKRIDEILEDIEVGDNGVLPWDEVAQKIDENLDGINAYDFEEWLEDNEDKIEKEQFK